MPSRSESQLWQLVKKRLPGVSDRVECTVASGMPDVNGTAYGQDYWIELKVDRAKDRQIHPFDLEEKFLEPSQRAWHRKRLEHGALIFILLRREKGITLYQRYPSGALNVVSDLDMPIDWEVFYHEMSLILVNWNKKWREHEKSRIRTTDPTPY